MFENIANFFKKLIKTEAKETTHSKDTAKERLHLVLMQDRANVSADFLELMKQEIIEVIKKYIEVEEAAIDVRLTNEIGENGEKGAPSLYANIPIVNIKNNIKKEKIEEEKKTEKKKDESIVDEKNEPEITEKNEDNKEQVKEEENDNKEVKTEGKKLDEEEIKLENKVEEKDESINNTQEEETKNTEKKEKTKNSK